MERMDEKNDSDNMLPGFRFHPTDEELVEFYLKRKLQHRPLQIELIKQVDIYKYDPWDLPKVASTGEKEWYFYCPRDRKYKNSTRPNRVTGSGFWKATGTDRPIYSSDGGRCIGLKKSLVFYRGRAARGIKTDWMMHEFRLPHQPSDKTLPTNDSWAICRIFKKPNSKANRAIAPSWTPSLSTTTSSDVFASYTTATAKTSTLTSSNEDYFPGNLAFIPEATNTSYDLLFTQSPSLYEEASKNSESLDFEATQHNYNGNYASQVIQESINGEDDQEGFSKNIHHMWEDIRCMGSPFSLHDSWTPDLPWASPPCTSEISSTTYSTNFLGPVRVNVGDPSIN